MARIEINWMRGWGNAPRIVLHDIKVPEYPSETDPIWERFEDGIHVARKGDFVFYFYTDGRPTDGFGGRIFRGTFKDGTTFEYKGAWSSRAACVNQALKNGRYDLWEYIVDVSVDHIAVAVTYRFLTRIWGQSVDNPDVVLGIRFEDNDKRLNPYWEPMHNLDFKGDLTFEYPA